MRKVHDSFAWLRPFGLLVVLLTLLWLGLAWSHASQGWDTKKQKVDHASSELTRSGRDDVPQTTPGAPSGKSAPPADSATQARDSRNDARHSDSMELLMHVHEFYSDNITKFPTAYQNGQLTAADARSEKTPLGYYKSVAFQTGAQPAAAADAITVVVAAMCAPDGSTTAASTAGSFAVQYGQEQADGSYRPICASY